MKLLFCDLETTGTMPWKHSIHQASGLIEIDGVVKEEFNILARPDETQEAIDAEIYKICKITPEELFSEERISQRLLYQRLSTLFSKYIDKFNKQDKFIFVGYNTQFDDEFLRKLWSKNGDKFYGSFICWPTLDVAQFALLDHAETRMRMASFKLGEVAKLYLSEEELTTGNLHSADHDIFITREIFRRATQGRFDKK